MTSSGRVRKAVCQRETRCLIFKEFPDMDKADRVDQGLGCRVSLQKKCSP